MRTLSIDIETYSSIDLINRGLYRYVEASDFEILLFAYAFDDEPVQVLDLAADPTIPRELVGALTDPGVIKTAWNAQFERVCLENWFGRVLPVDQWRCSMVHAYYLGLPGRLETAAQALNLDAQKDSAGQALIRYFSKPCKPTKTNGGRTRNLPKHDPERWGRFIEYCRQDVVVERAIRQKLERFPLPEREQQLWQLDQKINEYGIRLDTELVQQAISYDEERQELLLGRARALTGLENPNSVAQLKGWLENTTGLKITSLSKNTLPKLKEQVSGTVAERVLELREELAKTSVKKYQAMENVLCKDRRARGLLQFYGANRTGRWAGRLVQVQNLPRNSLKDLETARHFLRSGEQDLIEMLYDSPSSVLSELIRTAFIPSPGHRFLVADFSAIEARVIAWLADEQWRLDVFEDHGMIYEASAAQMFGLRIEDVDDELRQKGKIAELALGYGGSVGALKTMGALEMGLTEGELQPLVDRWRATNPQIVQLWSTLNSAAFAALETPGVEVDCGRGVSFQYKSGILAVRLPSGRQLSYVRPRIEPDPKFGRDGITYEGYDQGRWGRVRTYGGKLAENITQAVARDCLAEALLRLDRAGFVIAFHVHDEVVLDVPEGVSSTDKVCEYMSYPIDWAPGLPLAAEAFETYFYRKD